MRYFVDHFISIPANKMNVSSGHRVGVGKYEGEEDQHVARSHEGTPSINKESEGCRAEREGPLLFRPHSSLR